MLKARDIMRKKVISVKEETPIYEAIALLTEHNIAGMPVVRDDMTLAGILSEKDVLSLFHAHEDEEEKIVDDFMTQPALYFDEDESLLDVCDFLMKNIFRRVPVTSKGKLVGIISIKDFLEYILQPRRKSAGTT
ncbi:unnamed protein product [marine sediment metagenome]|uniref:CBS domain-containing protein n=1 Tax=marine sediment metagenome TaxID=412755 RepID=X1SPE1_9ZZZZ